MADRWATIGGKRVVANHITVNDELAWLFNIKLVDDLGYSLVGSSGGLKVEVVAGGGTGEVSSDVNVTDRANRILGRAGVDVLTLPVGLATEATLATLATDAGLASVYARLGDGSQHVIVDSVTGTVAISAAALPLPSGAATSAKQDTGNASIASLDAKVTACDTTGKSTAALQTTGNTSLSSIDGKLPALSGGKVPVDVAFPATQPVSGTFWQATQPVSIAATVAVSGPVTDTQLRASNVNVACKNLSNRIRRILRFHATAPATADTLLTLTQLLEGDASNDTGTSFAVTSGKRWRIQTIKLGVKANAAAAAWATATVRINVAGAAVIGSDSYVRLDVGLTAAVANSTVTPAFIDFGDDGLELSGTEQLGVSLAAQAVTNIISLEIVGYEYTP